MSLLDRIIGNEEPKLPVHQLVSGIMLVRLGVWTQLEFANRFQLTSNERIELLAWWNHWSSEPNTFSLERIERAFQLAESGYLSEAEIRNLLEI